MGGRDLLERAQRAGRAPRMLTQRERSSLGDPRVPVVQQNHERGTRHACAKCRRNLRGAQTHAGIGVRRRDRPRACRDRSRRAPYELGESQRTEPGIGPMLDDLDEFWPRARLRRRAHAPQFARSRRSHIRNVSPGSLQQTRFPPIRVRAVAADAGGRGGIGPARFLVHCARRFGPQAPMWTSTKSNASPTRAAAAAAPAAARAMRPAIFVTTNPRCGTSKASTGRGGRARETGVAVAVCWAMDTVLLRRFAHLRDPLALSGSAHRARS